MIIRIKWGFGLSVVFNLFLPQHTRDDPIRSHYTQRLTALVMLQWEGRVRVSVKKLPGVCEKPKSPVCISGGSQSNLLLTPTYFHYYRLISSKVLYSIGFCDSVNGKDSFNMNMFHYLSWIGFALCNTDGFFFFSFSILKISFHCCLACTVSDNSYLCSCIEHVFSFFFFLVCF